MANAVWTGAVSGDYGDGRNWESGAAPSAGDDVILKDSSRCVDQSLDQSAVQLNSFTIYDSFTGGIGLPGSGGYLKIDVDTPGVEIDYLGSKQLKINTHTNAVSVIVKNAGAKSMPNGSPVLLLISGSSGSALDVRRGFVGLACNEETEAASGSTVRVGEMGVPDDAIRFDLGVGATIISAIYSAGHNLHKGIATNITANGGDLIIDTTDALSQLNVNGATVYADRHGTITTLTGNSGFVDWLRTQHARTVTDIVLNPYQNVQFSYQFDSDVVIFTNGVTMSVNQLIRTSAA